MLDAIDINLARGIILILLILGFLGITAWAWSRNRKATFDHAARLPLEEDDGRVPQDKSKIEESKE